VPRKGGEKVERVTRIAFALLIALICGGHLYGEAGATDYDYVGAPTRITPFDSQYQRLQTYLEWREIHHSSNMRSSGKADSSATLSVLKRHLKMASRFRHISEERNEGYAPYGHSSPPQTRRHRATYDYWQLPAETEDRGAGDCEDKAIWLYARLIEMGLKNVRLVVGKYRIDQPAYHAWVVCNVSGRVYILDPTMNKGFWEARHYPKGFYQPAYSYSQGRKWRHPEGYLQLLRNTPVPTSQPVSADHDYSGLR
jgi:hypothetical protein